MRTWLFWDNDRRVKLGDKPDKIPIVCGIVDYAFAHNKMVERWNANALVARRRLMDETQRQSGGVPHALLPHQVGMLDAPKVGEYANLIATA